MSSQDNLNSTATNKSINVLPLILGPLAFSVIMILPSPEIVGELGWKVIAVALWMIIWWVTEAVSLSVTALLPLILFPLTGVFTIREISSSYAHPIIFLFMGGFLIALGIERRNLHKRIALNLVKATGTHPNGIILGFMISTAFVSMWISNTATTVMMLPIAMSVINLLQKEEAQTGGKAFKRFALCLLLGIAYSANIGGSMTIIGTPPNVVSIGFFREMLNYDLTFTQWLAVGLPVGMILITITYFLMTHVIYPSGIKNFVASEKLLHTQLKDLGPFNREEVLVSIVFLATAISWILRQPINNLFGTDLLNDTIIAMTGGILMFIIPINLKKGEFLLEWESTQKMPWGILILFGGGLSLAKGMEVSGLVELIGNWISGMGTINIWLLVLLLTFIMLFMTEIMSNVALATIFIPLVISISNGFGYPPLLLAIPATLAASYAFMMPISTPPNAIVFSSGLVKIKDMMRIGFFLNIISILILLAGAFLIIQFVF